MGKGTMNVFSEGFPGSGSGPRLRACDCRGWRVRPVQYGLRGALGVFDVVENEVVDGLWGLSIKGEGYRCDEVHEGKAKVVWDSHSSSDGCRAVEMEDDGGRQRQGWARAEEEVRIGLLAYLLSLSSRQQLVPTLGKNLPSLVLASVRCRSAESVRLAWAEGRPLGRLGANEDKPLASAMCS
ncbi:uncharacterized protein BDZ99DRAFT_522449 [Mytilinidion resinicola]|uniref:Uncharacterized protein n=1 Tax=Mytilinidion resinicola TaxID=574789 RepID=A0A6A6YIQ1_9PEZI|nr:uncharacterized protein BDZ99DRAFT_522449 [Mytilinidion resinicola]KAF2807835.1 hypothetical protein BDZ99DRAFT_522449 [Mytilinidion resinicola]